MAISESSSCRSSTPLSLSLKLASGGSSTRAPRSDRSARITSTCCVPIVRRALPSKGARAKRRFSSTGVPPDWSNGDALVLHSFRLQRLIAKFLATILFKLGIAALEPFHFGIALEGKDVGGDAVEEPAIV